MRMAVERVRSDRERVHACRSSRDARRRTALTRDDVRDNASDRESALPPRPRIHTQRSASSSRSETTLVPATRRAERARRRARADLLAERRNLSLERLRSSAGGFEVVAERHRRTVVTRRKPRGRGRECAVIVHRIRDTSRPCTLAGSSIVPSGRAHRWSPHDPRTVHNGGVERRPKGASSIKGQHGATVTRCPRRPAQVSGRDTRNRRARGSSSWGDRRTRACERDQNTSLFSNRARPRQLRPHRSGSTWHGCRSCRTT